MGARRGSHGLRENKGRRDHEAWSFEKGGKKRKGRFKDAKCRRGLVTLFWLPVSQQWLGWVMGLGFTALLGQEGNHSPGHMPNARPISAHHLPWRDWIATAAPRTSSFSGDPNFTVLLSYRVQG